MTTDSRITDAMETRLQVLDLVRRMTVGEDVGIDDQVALCDWVIDGSPDTAIRLTHETRKAFGALATPDAARYAPSGGSRG